MSLPVRLFFAIALMAMIAMGIEAASLIRGTRLPNDKLVCFGNVHEAAQPGRVITATRICNRLNYRDTINNIEVRDLGSLGRGGYAQITSGGLGQRGVTVYMWSQPGQPLDFSLNVHARAY